MDHLTGERFCVVFFRIEPLYGIAKCVVRTALTENWWRETLRPEAEENYYLSLLVKKLVPHTLNNTGRPLGRL